MAGLLAAVGPWIGAGAASAQIPDEFTNLHVFPDDVARADLIGAMRRISLALGVRCQHCHVGGDGVSFEGVDFASDDSPKKRTARWMMRMVRDLNVRLASDLPDRGEPSGSLEVGCKTCHRGRPRPVLLAQELRMALDRGGPDSLDAAYDQARTMLEAGMYDFREWEVNLLAEELEAEGRPQDAVAVWTLNHRHHPGSVAVLLNLGRLSEEMGRPAAAIEWYERALEIAPDDPRVRARLDALRGA